MTKISRREFIKISAAGVGAALVSGRKAEVKGYLPDVQPSYRLGRCLHTVEIKSKPDPDSNTLEAKYEDDILICDREVIGKAYSIYPTLRLWYETPIGYVRGWSVQPVKMDLNEPIEELPTYGQQPGMWAEVTVPYVDIYLDNPPARSPLLMEMKFPRLHFSQIVWIDGIKIDSQGEILYHVTEKHGSYGDTFWAEAKAFKIITPEETATIHPEIEDKRIVVDVTHQTISCYENNSEILFDRVSTGAKFNNIGEKVDFWATPVGDYHVVNRKYLSLHMAGGTAASGYELFAVSWTSIFATGGVAFHSTFWHNNYGVPMSHGCVNLRPDVAKFIFRWTQPVCEYDPGVIEILGYAGTKVSVIEY
jgi:hypothetical protein